MNECFKTSTKLKKLFTNQLNNMLSKIKVKTVMTLFFGVVAVTSQAVFAGDNAQQTKKNSPSNEFHLAPGLTEADYKANTIILKLKPEYRNIATVNYINDPRLITVFNELQAQNLGKIYPRHTPPAMARNAYGYPLVDLSLIYELNYAAEIPLEVAINKLIATGLLQYAEPRYIQYEHSIIRIQDIEKEMAAYNPNDPDITNFSAGMYYIGRIKCPDAWGINTGTARGDSTTVIGIVDSGTDIDHPDLKSKIRYNYKDPINGIDDDNDGFVDNFRGWDISENDNNPNVDNSTHGSHVSGCAAAATDNGVGVASPGFKCTFLPVKCAKQSSTTQIDNGYEGITYAADHGCQIINCSWGGAGGGQYALDVITYATINKKALVVASAGNANNEMQNFPGSFELVLCVASTTSTDAKSSFSTFGHFVDVCSPGSAIRSTVYNNSYTNMDGTSMASPICAGAAAIVKTFYPSYDGLQVGEQLRRTADDIYSLNSGYKEKLGSGRINLYRALTESSPSVRMRPLNISDKNDEVFVVNDTLYITGTIVDYLAPVSNLTATLSSTNANVTIINPTLTPGAMATLGTYAVTSANAFKVFIKPGTPVNEVIPFTITFKDGSYTDYQYVDVTVNVDYINIAVNDISTTNTSRGRIAWNNADGTGGLGFAYKDSAMIYESGLMIGVSSTKVSDNVRGSSATSNDLDFVSLATVKDIIPAAKAEYETGGVFNDNNAPSKIGVQVRHKTYAWTTNGNRKFVIFEYTIKNTSAATLSNLYAGIFSDWDVTDKTSGNNKAATDQSNKLGYVYSTVGTKLYGGTRVLTKGPFLHYAIDNVAGGGGGVDISDQTNRYSPSEKYTTLSTNRLTAGGTGAGNDVADVVSSGPFTINVNDSVKVAFALIAGDDLNDLINSSINAQIKYDNVVTAVQATEKETFSLKQNFPNPVNASKTVIEFYLPASTAAELTIYNTMGQKVMTVFNTQLGEGSHQWNIDLANFKSGIYFYELKAGNNREVKKMIVQTKED
jgi:serine protease